MTRRTIKGLALTAAWAVLAAAQTYTGPVPEKADLPYLKHAANLLATEALPIKEEKKGDQTIYSVEGANSTARTPLAAPIFLFKADKINPASLRLYRLESADGRRRIVTSTTGPEALRLIVTRLSVGLYRIEAYDGQDPGEYWLSAQGSNTVWCFSIF